MGPRSRIVATGCALLCSLALYLRDQRAGEDARCPYRIVDLGTLGGEGSWAVSINDHGQVVGESDLGYYNFTSGFLWEDGKLRDLAKPAGVNFIPTTINNEGIVAGFVRHGYVEEDSRAAISNLGTVTELEALPGYPSGVPYQINDRGEMVGHARDASAGPWDHTYKALPFLYSGGKMSRSGFLFGGNAINNKGEAVGCMIRDDGVHVVLKRGPKLRDVGLLPPASRIGTFAINDQGQIAGTLNGVPYMNVDELPQWPARAVLWCNGERRELPGLPGRPNTAVAAINNAGQVVGTASEEKDPHGNGASPGRAVLWENEQVRDLNRLIPSYSGWALERAADINGRGQIVGTGVHRGRTRAFLLIPNDPQP